ncbi:MAG TPA: helix-turn-helix domain-containing protein [Actinomycetes bacterium]
MPPASGKPTSATPRRYRSPHRAQQAERTRAAVVAAATRLFTANGWAATGMRDVAREAGVATETVYAHFSSKTGLLQRAMDVAVVGDDAPVALAERPEFAALAQGSRADRIAAAAMLLTEVNHRTSGFAKVLREAAPTDAVIAEMLRAARERIRVDIAAGAAAVMGRKPTRRERDSLWALLSIEVYLLLVEESGWSLKQYRAWVAEVLEREVPSS